MITAKKKTTKSVVKEPKTVTTLRKKVTKEMDKQFIKAIDTLKTEQLRDDNDWDELEIPHLRGGDWKWNFEKKKVMPLYEKVTWVLTAVNVAIFISLVIKNV